MKITEKTFLDEGFKDRGNYLQKVEGTPQSKIFGELPSNLKEFIRENYKSKGRTITIGVRIIEMCPALKPWKKAIIIAETLELQSDIMYSFSIDKSILPININDPSEIDKLKTSSKNKRALKRVV